MRLEKSHGIDRIRDPDGTNVTELPTVFLANFPLPFRARRGCVERNKKRTRPILFLYKR
jgi:hypothetical protein